MKEKGKERERGREGGEREGGSLLVINGGGRTGDAGRAWRGVGLHSHGWAPHCKQRSREDLENVPRLKCSVEDRKSTRLNSSHL